MDRIHVGIGYYELHPWNTSISLRNRMGSNTLLHLEIAGSVVDCFCAYLTATWEFMVDVSDIDWQLHWFDIHSLPSTLIVGPLLRRSGAAN